MQKYLPPVKPGPVVRPGEFRFAAAFLDHSHIYGQSTGLIEAGAELKWVYDPDPARVQRFRENFPQAKVARSFDEILADGTVQLVAAAAITSERGPIGCRVLRSGKDYFTDKAPFTTLGQLADARRAVAETRRKYLIYYSERLHVESAMFAGDLVRAGAIGRVVHVTGFGPHRLSKAARPDWFFERERYGGILCDIGSHQFEQFLFYADATDARVTHAATGNFCNHDKPGFEDFGEASLIANNGATNFIRVDWLTPNGLRTWGDGRTVIVGTDGYIETRKYVDIAREAGGDHVYLVNGDREQHLAVAGLVGFRFFGELIRDCMDRTEYAMTQTHAFKAAELCLLAQQAALCLTSADAAQIPRVIR